MTTNQSTIEKTIQQAAGQCVKCGLCLPHCPTYVVTENECESPRGRIALADALAKKQIPLTAKVQTYLDHCLTCRACEAVCPAHVPYGELIDNTRELMAKTGNTAKVPRSLTIAIKNPWLFRLGAHLSRFYQRMGLNYVAQKSGLLKFLGLSRVTTLLPASIKTQAWKTFYPAQTAKQGHVGLFIGCINQMIDQTTINAAIRVLTLCGFDVSVPSAQRCCGALYEHAGQAEQAKILTKQNLNAFDMAKLDAIITFTSGCAASLLEYPDKTFSSKVMDISHFLMSISWPDAVRLRPLIKRIALHSPCTLKNVVKQAHAPAELLKKIPGLEIIPLASNTSCCGAAGLYMVQHAEMADKLVENVINQVVAVNPDYLATSNIGCAVQIQSALRAKHPTIKVAHPVVLLAEQFT